MSPRYDSQILPAPPGGGAEDNEGSLLVGYVPTRRNFTAPGTSVRRALNLSGRCGMSRLYQGQRWPSNPKNTNQHQLLECGVALGSRSTVFADRQASLVN